MLFQKSGRSQGKQSRGLTIGYRIPRLGWGSVATALLLLICSPVESHGLRETRAEVVTFNSRKELIFVDQSLPDLAILLAGIDPNAEVILLDAEQDGIQQISEVLSTRSGIHAVHILSHGSPGAIEFGSSRLDLSNLETYAQQLQSWQQALDPNADIVIYGCHVAAGSQGELFIDQLAHLTQANIAASRDVTGHVLFGGNWVLEYRTGSVQDSKTFDPDVLAIWEHQLQPVVRLNFSNFNFGTNFTTEVTGPPPDTVVRFYTNVVPNFAVQPGGQQINARVTITFNNAIPVNIDNNSSNPARVQPVVTSTNDAGSPGGFIQYAFEFLDTSGNPLALSEFALTAIDIDGESASNIEFYEVEEFTNYQLDQNTQLVDLACATPSQSCVRFNGRTTSLQGLVFDDTASFIANFFAPRSSLVVRTGVTSNLVGRLFSFSLGAPLGTFTNVVTYTSPGTTAAPVIGILGNGQSIQNGSPSPNLNNNTDFGSTPVGSPVTRTFIIQNTGTDGLSLGTISVPQGFTIVGIDPSNTTIPPGGSVSLQIRLDANNVGLSSGNVTIPNNDADFTFAIAGSTESTEVVPPVANNDSVPGIAGQPVVVNILANDTPGTFPLDPGSVQIVGTANPGDPLVVPGQGTFTIDPATGAITFTPEAGFTGSPNPIEYTVSDEQGNRSEPATIRITVEVVQPPPPPGVTPSPGELEVRLVKRITAINGIPISGYINLPGDPNDDPGVPWPGGATTFLQGAVSEQAQPGSRIEFSIYFLLNQPAQGLLLCDPLVPGFGYVAGSLSFTATGNPPLSLTDAQDTDAGAFIPPGLAVPSACGRIPNPNGVVIVDLGSATSGMIRFNGRVENSFR